MLKNIIIISIAIITLSISSFAQRPTPGPMGGLLGVGGPGSSTAELVFQNGGQSYGKVTAFNGSHFELYVNDGSVIKTWPNSCYEVNNGVKGYQCSFTHFYNGIPAYSGYVMAFENAFVYLRWLYVIQNNMSYPNDTGWVGLMPKS